MSILGDVLKKIERQMTCSSHPTDLNFNDLLIYSITAKTPTCHPKTGAMVANSSECIPCNGDNIATTSLKVVTMLEPSLIIA